MNQPLIFFLAFLLLIISIKKPFVGIFIIFVLSTRVFFLVEMSELPTIKMAGIGDIQLFDLFLGILLIVSIAKIKRRQQEIAFKNIYVWLIILVSVNFLLSLFSTNFELRGALNSVRKIFSYSFYFVLIASMKNKDDITKLIKVIYTILIIAITIQFYEVITGIKLVLIERAELRPYWDVSPEITLATGEQVLYIWNRASVLTYLGLFLAFGYIFTNTIIVNLSKNTNKLIFVLGLTAFFLALTRSWLLYITFGFFITILFAKKQKTKFFLITLGLLVTFLIINQTIDIFTSGTINISQNLIGRVLTIFDVFKGENDSFNVRLAVYATQIAIFLQNPFLGHGFTKTAINEINGDVGVGNTLLQFGLFGLSWILFIIWSIYNKLIFIKRNVIDFYSNGISLGLLGAFSGMLLGYFFNWDFFGRIDGIIVVATIMAIIDRTINLDKLSHQLTEKQPRPIT